MMLFNIIGIISVIIFALFILFESLGVIDLYDRG